MVPRAGIFPAELTALRSAGVLLAILLIAYAVIRRHSLRNADTLILISAGLGLALVAGTEIVNGLLSAFSFEKGNGGRILGLAVFAIFILFLLTLRALSQSARNGRQLAAALEGLAWEEFRQAGLPERFRGKIAILIPAYNEAENIGARPRPDSGRGLRRRHRGPGRRRRLPRRHRRRRRRAWGSGRPARHQPRRRRGAADRLPADGRIGRR